MMYSVPVLLGDKQPHIIIILPACLTAMMAFLELYEVFLSLHVSGTLFSLRLVLLHQDILSQRKI